MAGAMGNERRASPRFSCRIPCELRWSGESRTGHVADISDSGLSVWTEQADLEQGDDVHVTLRAAGVPPIELEALAWTMRRGRDRTTGEKRSRLGLVLSGPSQDYFDLVARQDRRLAAEAGAGPDRPAAEPETPAPTGRGSRPEGSGRQYTVRAQERSSPRTVRLVVAAVSEQRAIEAAKEELGDDWEVLEARRVVGLISPTLGLPGRD